MKNNSYVKKYNEISNKLLLDFLKKDESANIIFSPLSILILLGVAAESVSGDTRDEILDFIRESADQDIIKILSDIEKTVRESGRLTSANAVIISQEIKDKVKESYISDIKKTFDAEIFSSENMVDDVNEWVSKKTKGMISDIADDSMEDMLLAFINAISFMSEWADIYDEDDIHPSKFHNLDGTSSNVEMLNGIEHSYIENDFFTGFTKKYEWNEFSFMALLPKKKRNKANIKMAISKSNLSELYNNTESYDVHTSMPEYKVEFSEDINALLEENGITQIFTDSADFNPITDRVPLNTESIIHKAFIEVDRNGTRAAAVTFGCDALGLPCEREKKTVKLNRPFIFAIMHNSTGLPIFVGAVNNL